MVRYELRGTVKHTHTLDCSDGSKSILHCISDFIKNEVKPYFSVFLDLFILFLNKIKKKTFKNNSKQHKLIQTTERWISVHSDRSIFAINYDDTNKSTYVRIICKTNSIARNPKRLFDVLFIFL